MMTPGFRVMPVRSIMAPLDDLPAELEDTPFAYPLISSGCGPGWYPLLSELHAKLIKVDPEYSVDQFKEKFGMLTVYVRGSRDELFRPLNDLCNEMSRRSQSICEECGQPGELRSSLMWRKTLCDTHFAGRS